MFATDAACRTTVALDLAALMRKHRVTLRELKARMGITLKRIRAVRAQERVPYLTYCDFVRAVTGEDVFNRARWEAFSRKSRQRYAQWEWEQDARHRGDI